MPLTPNFEKLFQLRNLKLPISSLLTITVKVTTRGVTGREANGGVVASIQEASSAAIQGATNAIEAVGSQISGVGNAISNLLGIGGEEEKGEEIGAGEPEDAVKPDAVKNGETSKSDARNSAEAGTQSSTTRTGKGPALEGDVEVVKDVVLEGGGVADAAINALQGGWGGNVVRDDDGLPILGRTTLDLEDRWYHFGYRNGSKLKELPIEIRSLYDPISSKLRSGALLLCPHLIQKKRIYILI